MMWSRPGSFAEALARAPFANHEQINPTWVITTEGWVVKLYDDLHYRLIYPTSMTCAELAEFETARLDAVVARACRAGPQYACPDLDQEWER